MHHEQPRAMLVLHRLLVAWPGTEDCTPPNGRFSHLFQGCFGGFGQELWHPALDLLSNEFGDHGQMALSKDVAPHRLDRLEVGFLFALVPVGFPDGAQLLDIALEPPVPDDHHETTSILEGGCGAFEVDHQRQRAFNNWFTCLVEQPPVHLPLS